MGAPYKKFDGGWDLTATLRPDGSIATAKTETIIAAQLMLIRDELRKQTGINKEILRVLRRTDRRAARKVK